MRIMVNPQLFEDLMFLFLFNLICSHVSTSDKPYTVKSGYRLLQTSGATTSSPFITDWTAVWKRSVPPKVLNLLWRSLSGCLPTLSAIRSRQVNVENLCPMCSNAVETDLHALIKCMVTKSIWAASTVGDHSEGTVSITDWWNNLRMRCTGE